MKSESKEIESEVDPEVVVETLFEEIVAAREWSIKTAVEYWDQRVEFSQEHGDPVPYPAHIQTVLDTAWYIEKFLMGEFKSE
jgi:hypothetical protein